MAFNDVKDGTSIVYSSDWNDFVNYTEDISSQTYWMSGSYAGHSSNTSIHYPSSSLDGIYHPSGYGTFSYISSSIISGGIIKGSSLCMNGTSYISGHTDINDTEMGVLEVTRRAGGGTSVYETMNMIHHCTTTPVAGTGVGNYFKLTNTNGDIKYTNLIGSRWQVPTAGSAERSQMVFSISQGGIDPGGIASVKMILDSQGNLGIGYCPHTDYVDYKLKVSGSLYAHVISANSIQESILTDKLDDNYYPSSVGNTLYTGYTNHSGNTDIHFPSSNIRSWLDNVYAPTGAGGLTKDQADGYYYPSSLGNSISGSYYGHSSNTSIHFTKVSLDDDYYPSGLGNSLNSSYSGHSGNTSIHYISSQFYGEFYPSSIGNGLSGTVNTHITSSQIHYPSSSLLPWLASGTHIHDDRYYTESESDAAYHPSGYGTFSYISSQSISSNSISTQSLTYTDTNQASGMLLTSIDSNGTVAWKYPPMSYSIENIQLSAQQNINMAKFTCPIGKNVYVWQAYACNSGGTSVGDLCIELLSGSTSIYKTSSAILQQGNPLAVSNGGNTEIRFMYSGGSASGYQYGTAYMQVSVY